MQLVAKCQALFQNVPVTKVEDACTPKVTSKNSRIGLTEKSSSKPRNAVTGLANLTVKYRWKEVQLILLCVYAGIIKILEVFIV